MSKSNGHEDCVFCKIIAGEIPAQVVYDSERVLGFLDIRPAHELHVLFIPKYHIARLDELQASEMDWIQDLFAAALEYAKAQSLTHQRLLINTGEPFQEVFHLHLHLLSGARLKSVH